MLNFGLPEVLMLFEVWQRAPDFLMRQLQFADVMKKNAEDMLDLFTGCFSGGAGGIPELGLGNAEIKVVATAWNRHLLLYNNARIYNTRSWIMQFVLYFMGFATTGLSVLTSLYERHQSPKQLVKLHALAPLLERIQASDPAVLVRKVAANLYDDFKSHEVL